MPRFVSQRSMVHVSLLLCSLGFLAGCRSTQYARIIQPGEAEMVGSHQAGQETYDVLIDEAVCKLLARHESMPSMPTAGEVELLPPPHMSICFVGVENRTAE